MKWLKERSSGLMRRSPGAAPLASSVSGWLVGSTAQERPVNSGLLRHQATIEGILRSEEAR
jgi:hypothetical protein